MAYDRLSVLQGHKIICLKETVTLALLNQLLANLVIEHFFNGIYKSSILFIIYVLIDQIYLIVIDYIVQISKFGIGTLSFHALSLSI